MLNHSTFYVIVSEVSLLFWHVDITCCYLIVVQGLSKKGKHVSILPEEELSGSNIFKTRGVSQPVCSAKQHAVRITWQIKSYMHDPQWKLIGNFKFKHCGIILRLWRTPTYKLACVKCLCDFDCWSDDLTINRYW